MDKVSHPMMIKDRFGSCVDGRIDNSNKHLIWLVNGGLWNTHNVVMISFVGFGV